MMGTPSSEAGWFDTADSHEVTLTEGFWLLETPVTQAMWESIMGTNPCKFRENSNLPVESVNWIECKVFCSWISDRLRCKAFLPTEAQWEYACRAGTGGPYGGCGNLDNMGWYTNNSDNKTHEVGLKQPNAWGLRDMYGNVCEWCADWKEAYNTQIFTDPQGPSTGSSRVVRGGCWSSMPKYCRSSYRYSEVPDSRHDYVGFRFLLMDELFSDEETD